MVTILDVAKHAGVSKSTVSLVINNSPQVKEDTRCRVEKAIKELGYVINLNARGLIKNETKNLGVIIAIENQPCDTYDFAYETGLYSFNISNGISEGLQDTDYGLLTERFCAYKNDKEIPKLIKDNRVDGVFLVGGLFRNNLIDEIRKRKLPVVAVGRFYDKIDSVFVDVKKGVYLGVKHLIDHGHRKISYINSPQIYASSKERTCGFKQAMYEKKIDIKEEWIAHSKYNTGEGGYQAFKSLWESGVRPDAIAAANEPIALGIMRYLYEKKIRIPDDISIVAYESSVLGGYASPSITSINISKGMMGNIAAQILLERIDQPNQKIKSMQIDPKLIVRNSVKGR